jgi:hypothetical protein
MDGTTAAVEDEQTWIVSYSIRLDASWLTREARVTARTAAGRRETVLAGDGEGRWSYARLPDHSGRQRYRYAAPAFGFTCTLVYDESGLVLDYPGIAVRAR